MILFIQGNDNKMFVLTFILANIGRGIVICGMPINSRIFGQTHTNSTKFINTNKSYMQKMTTPGKPRVVTYLRLLI